MSKLLHTVYANEADLLEQIGRFIRDGADLDETTEYGESPLRVASNNGRFDAVQLLLDAGADMDQLGWNELSSTVIYGTCDAIRKAVQEGGDLESRDYWSRTPLLLAIFLGDIAKAALLLELGADRHAVGRCGKTPLQYAVEGDDPAMLEWLLAQGYAIDSGDEFMDTPAMTAAKLGMAACLECLIAHGADLYRTNDIPEKIVRMASTMETVRMLLKHGADIHDLSPEMHAELLGIEHEGEVQATHDEYLAGRHRRFGASNPEKMDQAFWLAMVRSGTSAWAARNAFHGESENQPGWTYQRFGRSTTLLPDGRIVEIAGEHEDYYDPDFCIYNDVTVFHADGTIDIYAYPREVFAPTDFHSASHWGNSIVIIGNLGYDAERKPGHTPVYRLKLDDFSIEKINTTGESPGWIHRHTALVENDRYIMLKGGLVERDETSSLLRNVEDWQLDLNTWHWSKVTDRQWRQWSFVRADRKHNHLWKLRHAIWKRKTGWQEEFAQDMKGLAQAIGHTPDLDLIPALYLCDDSDTTVHKASAHRKPTSVRIDGTSVHIEEGSREIRVLVEGRLPDEVIGAFQQKVLSRLASLEGTAWEITSA